MNLDEVRESPFTIIVGFKKQWERCNIFDFPESCNSSPIFLSWCIGNYDNTFATFSMSESERDMTWNLEMQCSQEKKQEEKDKGVLESWNLPKDNPEPGESSTTTQLFVSRTTGQQPQH